MLTKHTCNISDEIYPSHRQHHIRSGFWCILEEYFFKSTSSSLQNTTFENADFDDLHTDKNADISEKESACRPKKRAIKRSKTVGVNNNLNLKKHLKRASQDLESRPNQAPTLYPFLIFFFKAESDA